MCRDPNYEFWKKVTLEKVWVTMKCQCRFISDGGCSTLLMAADSWRGCACVGQEVCAQFCDFLTVSLRAKKRFWIFFKKNA